MLFIQREPPALPAGGLLGADRAPRLPEHTELPAGPSETRQAVERAGGTLSPPDGKLVRRLHTFLDGNPFATALLTTQSMEQPAEAFDARQRSTVHEIPEVMAARDGDDLVLIGRGAMVRSLKCRDVKPGDNRIDLEPVRTLVVQLVDVPPGLHEAVEMRAYWSAENDESPVERRARHNLGSGLMPATIHGDRCELPMTVDRSGEVTVSASPRGGGAVYTAKQRYPAGATTVFVDLSSLRFCLELGVVDVALDFAHAHPHGKLSLGLVDGTGRHLASVPLVRNAEPRLTARFPGVRPDRYRLLLRMLEDRHSAWVGGIDVQPGQQAVRCDVSLESRIDVVVQTAGQVVLDACRLVVWDEQGSLLGDPGQRGERAGTFTIASLPAGTYFVQARAEAAMAASRVERVVVGSGDVAQVSLTLGAAGRVTIERSAATPFADFVDASGTASRFHLTAKTTREWHPAGACVVHAGATRIALDVVAGGKVGIELP
jgi:hypothetical protein